MKKNLSVVIALIMLTTTASASVQLEQCEQQLKGNWTWNGTVNQWQCLDENQTELSETKPVVQSDANATGAPLKSGMSLKSAGNLAVSTAIVIVAAPFVIIGTVVTAIVVAPVYLVKKIFGSDKEKIN